MFMYQNQEIISVKSLIDLIAARKDSIDCTGLSGSEKSYMVSRLYMELQTPLLVIVSSPKNAENLIEDLQFFLGGQMPPARYFPPYNILPHKFLAYHNETAAKRIRTLYQMISFDTVKVPPIMVTTAEAVLQLLIPKHQLCNYAELIMTGEDIETDHLIEKLVSGGYVRSTIVEEPGDFCLRGGILDIFSPLYPDPLRIELFGDTVDSLRFFSAATQRTTRSLAEAVILPAREVILQMASINEFITRLRKKASAQNLPGIKVKELIDRIKKEGLFPGIESLLPLIYQELDSFFDYVRPDTLFILMEPGELEKSANAFEEKIEKNYLSSQKESRLSVLPETFYLKWSKAEEIIKQKKPLILKALSVSESNSDGKPLPQYNFTVKDNSSVRLELKSRREKENLLLPLADWINDKKASGYRTLLLCSSRSRADRLKLLLEPYGIQLKLIDNFFNFKESEKDVYACLGQISSGFVWQTESIAIITENEIFGVKHKKKKKTLPKIQSELIAFEDLKKGDLVVHTKHGIGQYQGLVKLKLNGSTNDFLLILYRNDDKLYLPVDRMSMVQKYMGIDGISPVLGIMGGKSWENAKKKAKKSVEKIAGELLKLYAKRKVENGFPFKNPGGYILDFEAGFPYEETSDQLRAIEDVLKDMEDPTPMDRLVCGDVGYGKTEVALRASFTAVNNGKQVAMLVPTTVLAEQHFSTFSSRFRQYPFNIECLSRFRPIREQKRIVNDIKTGKTDIIIGTHRLLQKDIGFKNLGLIILDEEQRFGVKHKEKLKNIKSSADVLALTATPIPRTLHLSMMGIRDISIISTPPEHRRSIITYISKFDDAVIIEAIKNELSRKGQIFFIHNETSGIWKIARHLKGLVPEVRLDVAHGRMNESELEKVMLSFLKKKIDMLVCTTIVESGLDISSANTIIINRADRFGLSQIYQLRGRVGRSDEQAYAYLFIPDETALSKNAQKRLKVLMEHTDLGSGFQIATSDLKIRGGGTILGSSQSGHIAAIGYDMFLKLMEVSMSEIKGEPVQEDLDPEINITISAYIPESYIPDIDQRLSAYRRLAKMTDLKEIAEIKSELVDRYGVLPNSAANLLLKIMLKVLSIKAGVKRLDLTGHKLSLYFSEAHQKHPFGIVDMIAANNKSFEFTPDHIFRANLQASNLTGLLVQSKNILKEISQRVNG